MKNWKKYLFIITLSFFALGFVNIIFALFGFACLILPFIFLAKDKKKTWCQHYCPRASLFTVLFQGKALRGKTGPDWLIKGKGKWLFLMYFAVNFFMIIMSTIMVFKGRREPIEYVRFMIVFQLPWELPQFLNIGQMSDWLVHLSYRIYSMMFTTTVFGLILGWLFLPRTWCRVCPINTLSDMSLKTRTYDKQEPILKKNL